MSRKLLIGIIACVILANAGLASFMLGWQNSYPGLSTEDMEIIKRTARVEMKGKPVGTVLNWKNPATGAIGTVRLIKRFFVDGQECREIQHTFKLRDTEPWRVQSTICLQPNGSWKFL